MKISRIAAVCITTLIVSFTAPVMADDNADQIASLLSQITRLQDLMSLGLQEMDRVGGQGAQGLAQQITMWESQLSNIDTQIAKMDDTISKANEQQRIGLTQSLNNLLRQKAGAEAYLIQQKLKYEAAVKDLNTEKSLLTGKYTQDINALNQQLDNLIQVNCCINGVCSQKSRAECAAAGGTEGTN